MLNFQIYRSLDYIYTYTSSLGRQQLDYYTLDIVEENMIVVTTLFQFVLLYIRNIFQVKRMLKIYICSTEKQEVNDIQISHIKHTKQYKYDIHK